MISVNQCTPHVSLAITINSENRIVTTLTIFVMSICVLLLFIYNSNVGITLNTSNVVDEG